MRRSTCLPDSAAFDAGDLVPGVIIVDSADGRTEEAAGRGEGKGEGARERRRSSAIIYQVLCSTSSLVDFGLGERKRDGRTSEYIVNCKSLNELQRQPLKW